MSADYLTKHPNEILDFPFDFTGPLADSETISTKTITITPSGGLTEDSLTESSGVVTPFLSAGDSGKVYRVVCKITTNQSRTDEQERAIRVI